MVSLISDTNSACKCLDILLSMVNEGRFISWKVVLWVILDVNPLNRLGLLTTWPVLLQIKLSINIILVITMSYEGTLVSF